MKALAEWPAAQGIAAMQRINVAVLNPLFLGVFVGTAILATICAVAGFFLSMAPWSILLLLAAIGHVVGCFGVTMVFNVPRNEWLANPSSK